MTIAVRYMAQLRQAAGVAAEDVETERPLSAIELLRLLAERRGPALRRMLLTASESPQPTLLVFAGDEQIDLAEETPLRDGSTVTLLSPIAGG